MHAQETRLNSKDVMPSGHVQELHDCSCHKMLGSNPYSDLGVLMPRQNIVIVIANAAIHSGNFVIKD